MCLLRFCDALKLGRRGVTERSASHAWRLDSARDQSGRSGLHFNLARVNRPRRKQGNKWSETRVRRPCFECRHTMISCVNEICCEEVGRNSRTIHHSNWIELEGINDWATYTMHTSKPTEMVLYSPNQRRWYYTAECSATVSCCNSTSKLHQNFVLSSLNQNLWFFKRLI